MPDFIEAKIDGEAESSLINTHYIHLAKPDPDNNSRSRIYFDATNYIVIKLPFNSLWNKLM